MIIAQPCGAVSARPTAMAAQGADRIIARPPPVAGGTGRFGGRPASTRVGASEFRPTTTMSRRRVTPDGASRGARHRGWRHSVRDHRRPRTRGRPHRGEALGTHPPPRYRRPHRRCGVDRGAGGDLPKGRRPRLLLAPGDRAVDAQPRGTPLPRPLHLHGERPLVGRPGVGQRDPPRPRLPRRQLPRRQPRLHGGDLDRHVADLAAYRPGAHAAGHRRRLPLGRSGGGRRSLGAAVADDQLRPPRPDPLLDRGVPTRSQPPPLLAAGRDGDLGEPARWVRLRPVLRRSRRRHRIGPLGVHR